MMGMLWDRVDIVLTFSVYAVNKDIQGSRGRQSAMSGTVVLHEHQHVDCMVSCAQLSQLMYMFLQQVMWDRVVVDEAHQEPGLLELLLNIPKRSVIMLTGTPINEKVSK